MNTTDSLARGGGGPDPRRGGPHELGRVGVPGERRGGPETNTTEVLDTMEYTDEPEEVEVLGTRPADGWFAVLEGRGEHLRAVPLVMWSEVKAGENILLYGVVADHNLLDLTADVGDREDFRGYVYLGLNFDPTELTEEDIERVLEKQSVEDNDEHIGG
jgi:hypothetical protein